MRVKCEIVPRREIWAAFPERGSPLASTCFSMTDSVLAIFLCKIHSLLFNIREQASLRGADSMRLKKSHRRQRRGGHRRSAGLKGVEEPESPPGRHQGAALIRLKARVQIGISGVVVAVLIVG